MRDVWLTPVTQQNVNAVFRARQHDPGRRKLPADRDPDNCIGLVHKHWISQTRSNREKEIRSSALSFIRTAATFPPVGWLVLINAEGVFFVQVMRTSVCVL
jgi:hypothetical protein